MTKISFVIADVKISEKEIAEIVLFAQKNFADYEILLAGEEQKKIEGVNYFQFKQNTNQDAIINRLITKIEGDELVVVRKYTGTEDLVKLIKSITKTNQIAVYKKTYSKFKQRLFNFINIIINLLFGYQFYGANLSAMVFSTIPTSIIKTITIPSLLTKVNRWTGMEIVGEEGGKKVNFQFNKKINIIEFSICYFVGIVLLVCAIIWGSKIPRLYLKFLVALVIILSFILGIIFTINFVIKCKIGENNNEKANSIN